MAQTATKQTPTRHVLLSAADLPAPTQRLAIQSLEVGSWNGGEGTTIYVRELAASEMEIWTRIMRHVGGSPPIDDVVDYLMCAICTPEGTKVLTTAADREALLSQSIGVLFSIFTRAMDTATISTASIEAEKKG